MVASLNPDYASYAQCMEEIKRRLIAINDIMGCSKTTSYKYTNVEFVALQFRKIFELIILSSLASNEHLLEGLARKLAKEWEIRKIVAIVQKKNPSFYPQPVKRIPSNKSGVRDDLVEVKDGYLTLNELIAAHGRIGALMHASSPYLERVAIEEIEREFATWKTRLANLLDNHLVRFPGDDGFLYVGMVEVTTGNVHTAVFQKLPTSTGVL